MSQRLSLRSASICSSRNGLIGYASPSLVCRYLANTSVWRASSIVCVAAAVVVPEEDALRVVGDQLDAGVDLGLVGEVGRRVGGGHAVLLGSPVPKLATIRVMRSFHAAASGAGTPAPRCSSSPRCMVR